MSLKKANPDSVLPAAGSRVLRTIARANGTFQVHYIAVDTSGVAHEVTVESTTIAAWIAAAIATPGTNADVDTLMAANPSFTAAYLAVARSMLFIYCDQVALGFAEP